MNWKLFWSILAGVMGVSIFVMCAFISITGMAGMLDSKECQDCNDFLEHGDHEYILALDCPVSNSSCPVSACPIVQCPVCMCTCPSIDNTNEELFSYEDLSIGEQQSLKTEAEYLLKRSDCYKLALFDLTGDFAGFSQYRDVNGPIYDFNKVFSAWIITRLMDGSTQQLAVSSGKVLIDIDARTVECTLPSYEVIV